MTLKAISAHYEFLMTGRQYELDGAAVCEKTAFTKRDIDTMKRLMSSEMTAAWESLDNAVGGNWLPRVFDALWQVSMDWERARSHKGGSRKCAAKRKVNQIKGATTRLECLLNELDAIARPAGGGPARNPDQWPDSPSLRLQLEDLKDRCSRFDAGKMSPDSWVNAVVSARERGREYLRALVKLLDEMGFPFGEKRTPPTGLIDLADAAAGADGGIDYDAFYAVLQPERKRRSG
jgi:hypothetical protein